MKLAESAFFLLGKVGGIGLAAFSLYERAFKVYYSGTLVFWRSLAARRSQKTNYQQEKGKQASNGASNSGGLF